MVSHKVIISGAVAGSINTPSMSPPVMPAEIAESALGAAVAGANAQQGNLQHYEGPGLEIATPAEAREISRAQRRRQGRL
jgi:uncharacterized protein (DUF849 family)